MAAYDIICLWCEEDLAYSPTLGFVHQGGGAYKQSCRSCGWSGAPPSPAVLCPSCGSRRTWDMHAAVPKRVPSGQARQLPMGLSPGLYGDPGGRRRP